MELDERDLRVIIPKVFKYFGFSVFASLSEKELSKRPESWVGDLASFPSTNGANLFRADLRFANAVSSFLVKADLRHADLRKAVLANADLRGASLTQAKLQGTVLSFANLTEAGLFAADLERADVQGANLQGADLAWANLQGADLQGANLQRANVSAATFWGANLTEVNLKDAKCLKQSQLDVACRKPDGNLPELSAELMPPPASEDCPRLPAVAAFK